MKKRVIEIIKNKVMKRLIEKKKKVIKNNIEYLNGYLLI